MKEEEFAWIKRIEAVIDECWDVLTKWEQTFIEDFLERFRCWGKDTKVSAKQWEIIARISDKVIS